MTQTASSRAEQYGDALSDVYDLMYPWHEAQETAARLAALAGDGARALELGVGSGRIALPLAAAGVRVHGVDASQRMLELLARNDPGGTVTSTHGDMTTLVVEEGAFDLVYVVCNTLFMLEADEQVEVFRRAEQQLAPGGRFVVETYDPRRFHALDEPAVQARHLAADTIMIDTVSSDPVAQSVAVIHTLIRPGGVRTFVETSAYRWPAELDLVARLTGFELESRRGDWRDGPYSVASGRHVSVYRRPTPAAI